MTKEHAQTCPNVSEHEKKIGATKRDETRPGALEHARKHDAPKRTRTRKKSISRDLTRPDATKRDPARLNTLVNYRTCL